MQQIYTARDDMDAHFVQGLLEQEGIESVIQGEAQEGAWGNLPISTKSRLSIWVNEADAAKATPIIEEYNQREVDHAHAEPEAEAAPRPTWKCPKCCEEVEDQFDECWNCGTARPGTEGASEAPRAGEPKPG